MKKVAPNYWLLKSEPDCFSIDDLKKNKKEIWSGVRNYQARNFLMQMKKGDLCFFYHSSCDVPAIVGLCKVTAEKVVDPTQFEKGGEYFDPKSTPATPRWLCAEVTFVKKFRTPLSLSEIKLDPALNNMVVASRGSRLSVQPVSAKHFEYILKQVD